MSHEKDLVPPLPPKNHRASSPPVKPKYMKSTSVTFHDGARSIDFILVYNKNNDSDEKRTIFQSNLIKEGLELEEDESDEEMNLRFIKIHAPKDVCRRYCEILRLRMPMRKIDRFEHPHRSSFTGLNVVHRLSSKWRRFTSKILNYDRELFPSTNQYFTAVYSRDKEYLFDADSTHFFTSTVHARIVQFILDRTLFSLNDLDPCNFGIEHLVNDGIYCAAYPLHEGYCDLPGTPRYNLLHGWASFRNILRYQPLDYIKEYFGVKIALYFTWLGFYTFMLVSASLVGFLCFLYSWITSHNCTPCNEICNQTTSIKMCPMCDHNCEYWDIQDSCIHTRLTYLFDNWTTVLFTVFMCFWWVNVALAYRNPNALKDLKCTDNIEHYSCLYEEVGVDSLFPYLYNAHSFLDSFGKPGAMFLELWKRYSAEITHRWDLTELDKCEEYPRPEYLARLKHVSKTTVNLITNDLEPEAPFWTLRLPMTLLSFSVIFFLVLVAFAAVIGVVIYRLSILAALYACRNKVVMNYALILTNITAAFINLVCILILNVVYSWLAKYLTELELHRTQTEFDDSLTLKMYLFQFVNYYTSIIYIAFFKGKFVGYPGKYFRMFTNRQEECGLGGCLTELCIQLAIIMIGKQTMNTLTEFIQPLIGRWWNGRQVRKKKRSQIKGNLCVLLKSKQWVEDYKLVSFGPQALFPEYLEMVLQYGFVTIFASAFPLAPLFALLNNVLEMRLDAKKMLTFYRRPVSQRVKSIGIWYRILDSISKLAIFTNSFIIAFTSEFVPKMVYVLKDSPDHSLSGYLEYSLSFMNVSELDLPQQPENPNNIIFCRYKDFRNPPMSTGRYQPSTTYWTVMVARLLFMLIFQNFVTFVIILIRWCIPDTSQKLKEQIQREKFITNEIIIAQETSRVMNSTWKT